ncbi:cytochrome c [Crenobacter sp. SG2303]|uniref:Cytochrome c n=1 Tax=Crenobacter oryzisoli TaxID=3056844 RepID=A0ABT7XP36_9NEIS|nr:MULTISPECIES: cytochrome c [unclassified Crenobacter]MDN0075571.1 cytochrome c [Crenobacter sp. SG2303]MDN0081582.1 cytochrome c [Crenobacter sp. SG2305]
MKRFLVCCTLLAASATAFASPYQDRVSAFKTMLRTFEPMGVVVRGRDPYRPDQFQKQADALKTLARAPFEHFPPNSIEGKSRAKPAIWSEPAKFNADKQDLFTKVDALATAAQTHQLAEVKRAYSAVAQSCKACHDSFRGPEQ